jgi:Ca2+-binding EF-hand superfamily protein
MNCKLIFILHLEAQNFNFSNFLYSWLKKQFRKADVRGKGCLNFNEVLNLLNQLNISMHSKHARALFDVRIDHLFKIYKL